MDEMTVLVGVKEYKLMLESIVRLDVFSEFVKRSEYSISREECAAYLGFELGEEKEEDANARNS